MSLSQNNQQGQTQTVDSIRDREMRDPRVIVDAYKEQLDTDAAIRERVRQADRRRARGGA